MNDNAIVIPETNGYLNIIEYNSNDILLHIKATGNVGIGTSSPDKKLEIDYGATPPNKSTIGDAPGLKITCRLDTIGERSEINFVGYDAGQDFGFASIGAVVESTTTNETGGLFFATKVAVGATTDRPIERMRIDSTGGIFAYNLKSGTDQANAGAAANELYVDTNDDNTVKLGV